MSIRYVRRLGVLAGLALLVPMIAAAPVAADPYPNPKWPKGPDKGTHTYCFSVDYPAGPGVRDRVHYSMDNKDGVEAQTVVDTQYYSSCSSAIDVIVGQGRTFEGDNETFGETWCAHKLSNERCDRWNVLINNYYIQLRAANDGYQQRKSICHELGHSLGLVHYEGAAATPDVNGIQSCLRTGLWDNGAAASRTYGPHHRSHINNHFNTP
jgi:hypothetical protein